MRTLFKSYVSLGCILLVYAHQVNAAQFDATLQWSRRVELTVPVSGVIQEIYVEAGQKVAKGEKLLQLDDTVFKAREKQAVSTLKSAEEAYKESERELTRANELYNRTVLADHDLQLAKNAHVKATADRDAARYALAKAQHDFKYSTLRAPFNAIVLERQAQVGMVISADLKPETLLVLADADQMLARVSVSDTQLAQFKLGQAVKININDRHVEGVVKAIGFEPARGASGGISYPVDIEFKQSDQLLRAGLQVKVVLP